MDEDRTWRGGRSQPSGHCVTWGRSPLPQKGRSPQFLDHVYCDQMAALIKMPLGTEVGFVLRDIVFDVDPATPRERAHAHPGNLWPMSIVAKRLDG